MTLPAYYSLVDDESDSGDPTNEADVQRCPDRSLGEQLKELTSATAFLDAADGFLGEDWGMQTRYPT